MPGGRLGPRKERHDAFELANVTVLPKFGLEIRDHSTFPVEYDSSIVNLLPRQHMQGELESMSELRGLYTLGPTGARG